MYGVAQFMENGRLQVLAVPMSWIKKGFLMWPKSLSNEKIDKMRKEGTDFNGSTKPMPVIVTRKFRSFQAAEASVEELSKKDVSDFEAKKKQLKSAKKKKLAEKRNDYNVLCEAIVDKENQACSSSSVPIVPIPESSIAPSEQVVRRSQPLNPLINIPLEVATPMNISLPFSRPASPLLAPLFHLSLPQSLSTLPSVAQASSETAGAVQIVQELSTSNEVQERLEHEMVDCMPQQIQMKPLEITTSLPDDQSFALNPPVAPDENIQYEAYARNLDVEVDGADQVEITTDLDVLIKQNIFDAVNVSMQSYLDKHIEKVVDRAVSAAVDRSFASNFARIAAMTEALNKTATKDDTIIEIRPPVDTEKHVTDWNAELANDDLQMKYMDYVSKIIVPNSYVEKGDNAFYVIADCLFTRQFWNRFTWTGVNRGDKSKRGFREFGNVTELLLKLIQIGDPTYTRQQLEKFCKTRLFRHAKTRSVNKMLRKSSCRKKRGVKKSKPPHEGAESVKDTGNIESEDTGSDDEDMEEFENEASNRHLNDTDTSEDESSDESIEEATTSETTSSDDYSE